MKVYCSDCGSQMILRKFISMYSPSTGKPYYELEGRCPNARWWRLGHFTRTYNMPANPVKNPPKHWGTPMPKS